MGLQGGPIRCPSQRLGKISHHGNSLIDSLAPIPPKLVPTIQKFQFAHMAELLRDNLEVQRCATLQEQSSTPTSHSYTRRREIANLLSCVSCLGVYTAVLADKHPGNSKQLLVY